MDDEKEKNNVVDLAAEKEKRKSKDKKETKISQAQLFDIYAGILDKESSRGVFEPMAETFKVIETCAKDRLPVIVTEDKVCLETTVNRIVSCLARYWEAHFRTDDSLFLDPKKAEQVVKHWISRAKAISSPKPVAWKSEDVFCFRRLPFDFNSGPAFPSMFFDILERMSNGDAFCMFIGSLFYPEANRQQYVWIYGNGNDGKGCLSRFLYRVFGTAYAALTPPKGEQERFWNHQLLYARLGFFNECSKPAFPTSAMFKTLTGNDPVTIEPKGKPIFTAQLPTKFIFTSNEQPSLSNEKADHRRAIICEIREYSGPESATYEERLWNEAQDILSYCRKMYDDHKDKHGHVAIPVKGDMSVFSVEEDDRFELVLNKHFILSHNDRVLASQFAAAMKEEFHNRRIDENKFRKWMRCHHGVSMIKVKEGGTTLRAYTGIKMNSRNWSGVS